MRKTTFFCRESVEGPPTLVGDTLVVEGVDVARIATGKQDYLLLCWGAAFAVYAQKPTCKRYENTAYIMTNKVVNTDDTHMPKKVAAVYSKLF